MIKRQLARNSQRFPLPSSSIFANALPNIFSTTRFRWATRRKRPKIMCQQISATTGMPHVLARRNMAKIHGVLSEASNVINGLTRNIDWEILDRGFGEIEGRSLSFYPRTESLGVVLPNNSPAFTRFGFQRFL